MLFAAVCQSPVFGGEIKFFDEVAAKSIKGIEAVVKIPNGIAVVAESTWRAEQGLKTLKCEFEGGKTANLDSSKVSEKLRASLDEMGKAELGEGKSLDVEKSIKKGREYVEGSDHTLNSMKKETEEMLKNLKDKSNLSMDDILKSVINFSEMMENIEVASSEHASGISQVNSAISDMDKLTQENYVMVEQNSSASQKMAKEAAA